MPPSSSPSTAAPEGASCSQRSSTGARPARPRSRGQGQPDPGVVLLAPTDYHTLVDDDGTIALSTEGLVQNARPSIDVLFRSAADAYRERCVGVVLTGANEDGAEGLARIEELGGLAVVQEPGTAERRVMPAAALAATKAAVVLPLEEIGAYLRNLGAIE